MHIRTHKARQEDEDEAHEVNSFGITFVWVFFRLLMALRRVLTVINSRSNAFDRITSQFPRTNTKK